jgi:hypothetical protein
MEKVLKKILANKSKLINILYFKMKDVEENSWERLPDGRRRRDGTKLVTLMDELTIYGEAFLFELGSFFDIMIKFICGKNLTDKIYFNRSTLLNIQPCDDFINFLITCYDKGLVNSDIYNLNKMKEFRNAITHATFLDISRFMSWKAGEGFPTLENAFFFLPDNPNESFSNYTYEKRITLFRFIEEIGKIFTEITNKLNSENYYSKYTL